MSNHTLNKIAEKKYFGVRLRGCNEYIESLDDQIRRHTRLLEDESDEPDFCMATLDSLNWILNFYVESRLLAVAFRTKIIKEQFSIEAATVIAKKILKGKKAPPYAYEVIDTHWEDSFDSSYLSWLFDRAQTILRG
tara:strand:- start:29577 stop:29984 length:408 start_codon:yes stop_codon:yes gene_type:complete